MQGSEDRPAAIWWHFHRKGIPNTFLEIKRYAKCVDCSKKRNEEIVYSTIELCEQEVTSSHLPLLSQAEWKRESERKWR